MSIMVVTDTLPNGYHIAKAVTEVKVGRKLNQLIQWVLLTPDKRSLSKYETYTAAMEHGTRFAYNQLPRGGQSFVRH